MYHLSLLEKSQQQQHKVKKKIEQFLELIFGHLYLINN